MTKHTVKIKGTRPVYFTTTLGGPFTDTILTELGGIGNPRDILTLAKYEIKLFIIVTLVEFIVLALHQPSPLTRQSVRSIESDGRTLSYTGHLDDMYCVISCSIKCLLLLFYSPHLTTHQRLEVAGLHSMSFASRPASSVI